jgi:hypothetical protein
MVMCPVGFRSERDYAGETQQQLYIADPSSLQISRPIIKPPQLSKDNFHTRERKIGGRSQIVD